MGKINILDSRIYNKIAAGEVAERPASVVKELVENSIDARASSISVSIKNGGLLLITVADNGCGMDRDDAKKAFLPHATSKVASEDDLFSIASLGFRGEALASIAAVSKIEMTTRTAENETGVKVFAQDGQLTTAEHGGSVGTRITVSNLFYNTPARFKFLRKPRSEANEITSLMSRFILANPDISFSYSVDDEVVYENTGKGLEHAIFTVYGKDTLDKLIDINYRRGEVWVTGYVSKPDFVKANSTYQTQIVNGRWVVSPKISAAISAAYREFLLPRTYPFCVLNITLPHELVDVNVHPNKSDVRFSNSEEIFSVVYGGIRNAIEKLRSSESEQFITLIEDRERASAAISAAKQETIWQRPVVSMDYAGVLSENDRAIQSFYSTTESEGGISHDDSGKILNIIESEDAPEPLKIVGQLFNTYIIIEYYDRFSIVDQHAAHERLLYDRYERQLAESSIYTQSLLVPYTLTVNTAEYAYLSERLNVFTEAGFDISPFGNLSFVISCVPFFLSSIDFEVFFKELLYGIKNGGEIKVADGFKRYLMQKACKAAVKEGDVLTVEDIKALLNGITVDKPQLYCPHGRPILREFKKADVEKWFKRS